MKRRKKNYLWMANSEHRTNRYVFVAFLPQDPFKLNLVFRLKGKLGLFIKDNVANIWS